MGQASRAVIIAFTSQHTSPVRDKSVRDRAEED